MARCLVDDLAVRVVLVDSITEISRDDAGSIVVSGSHGGRSAAGFASDVPALIYVFNDAGVGKDGAGISGLYDLDGLGIAAVAVGHDSARIGDALDTFQNGEIRHANAQAHKEGVMIGSSVRAACSAIAPSR
ncbi:MAG: hypothetical protein AAGI92_00625 [Pseudomonadota bacterium]